MSDAGGPPADLDLPQGVGTKALLSDSNFDLVVVDEDVVWGRCRRSWENGDVHRLREALQPLIDGGTTRFVMDLRVMEDITLSA
jgi:hypothetical protein